MSPFSGPAARFGSGTHLRRLRLPLVLVLGALLGGCVPFVPII